MPHEDSQAGYLSANSSKAAAMILNGHYNYPGPKNAYVRAIPQEVDINERLNIGDLPAMPRPRVSEELFADESARTQCASLENLVISFDGPLNDLLADSQAKISQYAVELPSARARRTNPSGGPLCSGDAGASGHFPTPTLLSQEVEPGRGQPQPEHQVDGDKEASATSADPLACHANNIMRMAMDSTMLGSFCNDTISSSFSNVVDESIPGAAGERSFGEDDVARRAPSLRFLGATKVEISAHDLEMAVSDPLRLA
ncbi:hypothetical protein METBIDRAFT_179786 [Metschnikowia bicuspidata var. bicuspidata NRRL YB-4993]|uniref:Uncharacterized protein n=1 Tax=Metschnikowia bicuspidata var. bicuspidata NRRL YB-4993 TaxID=869754 RepID=A0A1A0HB11_9ASCO|nr:hypothetical protein METBIDRAFT_179786 [Metschnikowia bicuspidata var. bicuspidata NRRL YB-4993]OBA21314.1 hypothetical protein METBIDRAFT_179786 [Metschnikowia bicuspidata var. bicuspidata NRRL YB-4993]